MKVVCDRAALLEAVNLVSAVVAARTPRLQLTCVKFVAVKGSGKNSPASLTLLGTDAEASLRLTLSQVDVEEAGECLIPADKLRQIVSAEDNEPTLTIEATGEQCYIRGADATFKVYGYPVADFPPIPEFEAVVSGSAGAKAKATLTQPASTLDALISRTLFATARENSRYAINGVLFKRDGRRLEMVATDGRRLALCRSQIAGPAPKDDKPIQCIVPTKGLALVQRLIRDPEEPVSIAVTENQIFFNFGGTDTEPGRAVLVSNLVEGAFPPYEDVIPKDQDKKVTVDRDVLSSAVRRTSLLTNEESRGVRMAFRGADRKVRLSSRAPEMGEAEVTADLAGYEGEDIEIGFNPQFISDALKVMPETEVIIELKAPNKPGLVKAGGKPGGPADFVYVVMPVNLQ